MLTVIIPTIATCTEKTRALIDMLQPVDRIIEIVIVNQGETAIKYPEDSSKVVEKRVNFRGLSRARNYGASTATTEYIAFLDDDVEVDISSLNKALKFLDADKLLSGISGYIPSNVGNLNSTQREITRCTITGNYIESALIFRRNFFTKYLFDETLGLGEFHGNCEGYDLLSRMLGDGNKFVFFPEYVVFHQDLEIASYESRMRYFNHGLGIGGYYVKTKNLRFLLHEVMKTTAGSIMHLLKLKPRSCYLAKMCGIFSALVVGKKV